MRIPETMQAMVLMKQRLPLVLCDVPVPQPARIRYLSAFIRTTVYNLPFTTLNFLQNQHFGYGIAAYTMIY